MPPTNDPVAAGIAPQPALQLTLARTRITASSEGMPRTAWRGYYNTVRRTAQELRDSIGGRQELREGMGGRLTEEGMVLKRDFDAALRVIDLFEALEDIFEAYERVVRILYRRAIDYMADRVRLGLSLYHEDEQREPEYEGEAQLSEAGKRYKSMKRSEAFLRRLVDDLKELKEQRPDVIIERI